jgi:uncharacterized protein YoaH (UPF0181 family)
MFDLEKAIANWRQQMMAVGVNKGEVLNELESHLRDDIEQEMRSGLSSGRVCKSKPHSWRNSEEAERIPGRQRRC